MALCTIDYVKSKIKYTSLTDLEVSDIIDEVSEEILLECGTTDETNPKVILAGRYAILAAVLTKMKTTGELAANITTGNGQRQNTTDQDIERYEKKSKEKIAEYLNIVNTTFSSPSFYSGFDCHGGHRGFH